MTNSMNGDYDEHTMRTQSLYNRGPHTRPGKHRKGTKHTGTVQVDPVQPIAHIIYSQTLLKQPALRLLQEVAWAWNVPLKPLH